MAGQPENLGVTRFTLRSINRPPGRAGCHSTNDRCHDTRLNIADIATRSYREGSMRLVRVSSDDSICLTRVGVRSSINIDCRTRRSIALSVPLNWSHGSSSRSGVCVSVCSDKNLRKTCSVSYTHLGARSTLAQFHTLYKQANFQLQVLGYMKFR